MKSISKKAATIILLIFFAGSTNTTFAEDYLEKIASESCDCVKQLSDTLDQKTYNMKLGICMIEAASAYKDELKRDYGIDFAEIDKHGEKLGQIIGMKMVGICPGAVMKMAGKANQTKKPENQGNSYSGKVVNVEENQFVSFSVKDENNKTTKFYWLTFIDSETDLINQYGSLIDKNISITYVQQEFFDPRIGEYRTFNTITKLQLLRD